MKNNDSVKNKIPLYKRTKLNITLIVCFVTFNILSGILARFVDNNIGNNIVYGITFFLFCYMFYLIIKWSKFDRLIAYIINQIKNGILKLLNKNKHYVKFSQSKFFNDHERQVFTYSFSTIVAIVYALVLMILGIVESSLYYGIFSSYYLVLISIKIMIIVAILKYKDNLNKKHLIRFISVILTFLLNCIAIVFISYMIFVPNKPKFQVELLITISIFTTYKIIASIVMVFKWKTKDILKNALKKINLIEALVTIMTLQTSMIAFFKADNDMTLLNYGVGLTISFILFIVTLWLVIETIVVYVKYRKSLKNNLETDCSDNSKISVETNN